MSSEFGSSTPGSQKKKTIEEETRSHTHTKHHHDRATCSTRNGKTKCWVRYRPTCFCPVIASVASIREGQSVYTQSLERRAELQLHNTTEQCPLTKPSRRRASRRRFLPASWAMIDERLYWVNHASCIYLHSFYTLGNN